ncbi:hypothetical protein [Limnohabitans sp.]|uniref:hypothetical protein n=1 Tax=Limnohabitans sp. TaxID=1907725 RepID=UPI00286EDE64|nr:hypothetical protein [Limnohabitans sp.]
MWHNPEAWIAMGLSVGFVLVGVVMHRLFVNVLKNQSSPEGGRNVSPEGDQKAKHE